MDIISKTEIIVKYTEAITRDEHEFKWGEIYQMIRNKNASDAGLEDIPLYENIRKS